jgi:hypothetical protein
MNIIGDIAGNHLTLMALLKKMPDEQVMAVGDLIDRGPRSKEVVEWFMAGNAVSLKGNHEHMMIDCMRKAGLYEDGIWLANGGYKTIASYGMYVPDDVLAWATALPLFWEDPESGLFVSHSFPFNGNVAESCHNLETDYSIIWSREEPVRMPGRFQVVGHNSQWGLRRFSDAQGDFAISIDTSRDKVLTGIHWPTKTIYQQPYID